MINEAIFCVMEGVATPEAIDTVMKLGHGAPDGAAGPGRFHRARRLPRDPRGAASRAGRRQVPGLSAAAADGGRGTTWGGRRAAGSTSYEQQASERDARARSDGHLRLHAARSATSSFSCPTIRRAAISASSRSTTPPWARRSAAPASGSTSSTEEAITDALRLARGMTYKSAVAGHQPRRRQVGHHR